MSGTPPQFTPPRASFGQPSTANRSRSAGRSGAPCLPPCCSSRIGSSRAIASSTPLWGEEPPETARNTIQVYISQLRKLLPDGALETAPPGYRLVVDPATVDLFEFVRLCAEGRAALAVGDAAAAAETLRARSRSGEGRPLADLAGRSRSRTDGDRSGSRSCALAALEDRIDADLALGRHGQLVAELERLVGRVPVARAAARAADARALPLRPAGRRARGLPACTHDARRRARDRAGRRRSADSSGRSSRTTRRSSLAAAATYCAARGHSDAAAPAPRSRARARRARRPRAARRAPGWSRSPGPAASARRGSRSSSVAGSPPSSATDRRSRMLARARRIPRSSHARSSRRSRFPESGRDSRGGADRALARARELLLARRQLRAGATGRADDRAPARGVRRG